MDHKDMKKLSYADDTTLIVENVEKSSHQSNTTAKKN